MLFRSARGAERRPVRSTPANELERRLLQALWHAPDHLAEVRGEIPVGWFEDGSARALAEMWWENGVMIPEDDDTSVAFARELAATAVADGWDAGAEVVGAVRKLKVRRVQHEMRERQARLKSAAGEQAQSLMQEIQELAKALHRLSH